MYFDLFFVNYCLTGCWFFLQIHCSKQGQAFKSHAHRRNGTWRFSNHHGYVSSRPIQGMLPALFNGCSLIFKDEKPSLSCDSVKLELDLTCSMCLVSFFISSYKRASYFINTSNYRYAFSYWHLILADNSYEETLP